MTDRPLSRRQFLGSAAVVGAAAVAPSAALGPSDPTPVRPQPFPVTLAPEVLPSGVARQFGAARFRDTSSVREGRFSADSRWLIWYDSQRCWGYELLTGRRVEFQTPREADWSGKHWLPTTDGRLTVIEASRDDTRVCRYDLTTGAAYAPLPMNGTTRSVSADGTVALVELLTREPFGYRGVSLIDGRIVWERAQEHTAYPLDPIGRFATVGALPRSGLYDGNPRLIHLPTGKVTPLEPAGDALYLNPTEPVWVSANGARLATVVSNVIRGLRPDCLAIWDTANGRLVAKIPSKKSDSLFDLSWAFGLTADGTECFGMEGEDRQLVVRNVATSQIIRRYPVFDLNESNSAVAPNGQTLVIGRSDRIPPIPGRGPGNPMLRLIDADTGATLPQSPDPPGPIVRVWFPTRDTTAAAFRTRVGHLDYVRWDTATGRGRRITDPTDRNEPTRTADLDPVPLASPHLQHFLRPDGSHLVVLHGPTGKVLARREQPSAANGRWFWLDSVTVGIFALDGLHLWTWGTDTSRLLPLVLPGKWPHVWRWRASADGRTVAVQFFPNLTGRACMVAWVDVPTGRVTTTEFGSAACGETFAASVDANRLAVQLGKEVFHVHDRSGWRGMFRVPNALPKCDLTACGRTLAVQRDDWTDDEGVRHSAAFELWEVSTGQRRWSRPIDRAFDDLRASPCGRFVATARADQPVYLWDVFGEVSDPQPEPTDGPRVWDALGSADAEVTFRAVRLLVQHPAAAVRLLSAKLKPSIAPKQAWVDERIDQLGHRDFRTRQTAEKELTAHADVIADYLRKALEAGLDTEEAEERLQRIVGRAMAPLDHVRSMRAVEVLEYAREASGPLLSRLANGASGLLTREASAAIRRQDR